MSNQINLDSYIDRYFSQATQITQGVDKKAVEATIKVLLETKKWEAG
ncbi:MAG: hypothetical protein Q7K98_04280 [Candidatus Omnitrophota bacterium]|nr:hypothetical protein [Candidatus Omnitrophota bacterium]